jgi:uncharacterized protein (TIGR03066 family)
MRLLLFLAGLLTALLVTSSLASPVPKDKRTTAEKLVGTWELVKIDEHILPASAAATLTFTKDKTYTVIVISRKRSPSSLTGRHSIEGNRITMNLERATEPNDTPQRAANVESVTDNTLALKSRSGSSDQIAEFRRSANRHND